MMMMSVTSLILILSIFCSSTWAHGLLQRESSRQLAIMPDDELFVKPLGASMVLTCKVVTNDGQGLPVGLRLRWLDGNDRDIVVNQRRYLEVDDHYTKLYLVNITRGDAGVYKCFLDDTVTQEKSITLNIYQDITFEQAPSNQYLRRHAAGVIQCVVSGQPQPTISWTFRGSKITTGGRYVVQEGGLEILNATDSDAGNYTCRAEVDEFGNYAERFISVAVNKRLFDECEIAVEHCAEPFEAALSGIESIEELYEKLRTTDLRETCGLLTGFKQCVLTAIGAAIACELSPEELEALQEVDWDAVNWEEMDLSNVPITQQEAVAIVIMHIVFETIDFVCEENLDVFNQYKGCLFQQSLETSLQRQCITGDICPANQFVRCVDDMVSAECGDEIGDKVGELYGRIMADFDCYRRHFKTKKEVVWSSKLLKRKLF